MLSQQCHKEIDEKEFAGKADTHCCYCVSEDSGAVFVHEVKEEAKSFVLSAIHPHKDERWSYLRRVILVDQCMQFMAENDTEHCYMYVSRATIKRAEQEERDGLGYTTNTHAPSQADIDRLAG